MTDYSSLSSRGKNLASNPARIDFELFAEAMENLYCPETNPEGTFPLNIAENKLMAPVIKKKLGEIVRNQEIPDWVMGYTALAGNPDVLKAIASFMSEHLCRCDIPDDSICLSAGAAGTIEVSSFVLANPGDVAVIPAPSYPMYTKDLGIKSGVERYDLQTHYELNEIGSSAPVKVEMLEKVWEDLSAQGKCFKILLITSPDNPTGCVYSAEELKPLADWCIQHKVHMIVNEIYGLSRVDTQDEKLKADYKNEGGYSSFASIIKQLNSDYLHLWYAFSKDFAISGLRIGVIHSLNKQLLQGLANVNVPHLVSNMTQWLVAELLKDKDFVKAYLIENSKKLTASYKLMVASLKELDIPFIPASGSFFIWIDLSKYLSADSDAGQEQLWIDIYRNTGLLLTPGSGFRHQKKGMFRVVFTAVPYSHLEIALERFKRYLSSGFS